MTGSDGVAWLSHPREWIKAVFSLNDLVARDKGTEPLLAHTFPDEWVPAERFESYAECRKVLCDAFDEAQMLALPAAKKQYLVDVLCALIAQAEEGDGADLSYAERVARFTGLPGEAVSADEIRGLQEALSSDLSRAGYRGPLATALETWRSTTAIAPEAFVARAGQMLERSITETRAKVVELPDEAAIEFQPIRGVYYRGYSDSISRYKARVTLNADLEWPLAALKHVVSHEGCPGHFAISAARAVEADQGRLALEERFFFANTPVTSINEGTCNLGAYLLGWFDSFDDLICLRADQLRSALLLNMCFLYHQDGCSEEEVVAYYKDQGAVSEASAVQTMRFVRHPLWHTSNPHYWHGTNQVFAAYEACLREDRMEDLVQVLFREIHTAASLGLALSLNC